MRRPGEPGPSRDYRTVRRVSLLVFDVETNVQRRRRVSQGADGDAVHAGHRDRADRVKRDATGRFELELPALVRGLTRAGRKSAVAHLDSLLHLRAVHVVEQDGVDPFDFQDLAELLERIDFDLDEALRVFRATPADDAREKDR